MDGIPGLQLGDARAEDCATLRGGFLVYIRGIKITNVKGFADVELDFSRSDESFSGWTVIAGQNGSGKSTLLKALALTAAGPA
ncbi:MAG TPA: ATP-binding protein, partial [Thermoanaerobaculia bacterium]|nr:ATP-binding protein [Thermoanaerobaculia bacterium]